MKTAVETVNYFLTSNFLDSQHINSILLQQNLLWTNHHLNATPNIQVPSVVLMSENLFNLILHAIGFRKATTVTPLQRVSIAPVLHKNH